MPADDPYRAFEGRACPRCATPLRLADERAPQACERCGGEWLSLAAVDELLCPEALDLANEWVFAHPIPSKTSCAVCAAPMEGVVNARFLRCASHGMWFDDGWRARLATTLAAQIQAHRDVELIAEMLRGADPQSLRAFARRFVALEARVAELSRRNRNR